MTGHYRIQQYLPLLTTVRLCSAVEISQPLLGLLVNDEYCQVPRHTLDGVGGVRAR